MIRTLLALMLLTLAATCGRGDSVSAPPKPALWEIAGPKGMPAGWLFGTVHALPEGTDWRTPRLEQALGTAQVLVVEVANLDDDKAIARAFARLAMDQPASPLAARVDPARRGPLRALVDRSGVAEPALDRLETWAAALTLARAANPLASAPGADRALVADFRGRPVVELEGVRTQLGIFDRLPERDQRDLLAAVIDESAQGSAAARAIVESWAAGDTARLERLAQGGLLEDRELRAALLTARNRAWTKRIAVMLRRGEQPFVAVGAAHLLGSDGLLALLEAEGYLIRRIQ